MGGTHYTRRVTMGGEVEVTSMVRRREHATTEAQQSKFEANVESQLDEQEAAAADESGSESVVTETSGAKGAAAAATDSNAEEAAVPTPPAKKSVVKSFTAAKSGAGVAAEVLKSLSSAAVAGVSGVVPLIKAAIENLNLKLSVSSSKSAKQTRELTSENNKNEVRFSGGDTAVDPSAGAQHMSFDAWKDSIKSDPAPISKTMDPISELMLVFAGPNSGEQCPSDTVSINYHRRRQMVECMSRRVLKEGRDLADTQYEIEQVNKQKAALEAQIRLSGTAAGTTETEQWIELCQMRMNLLARRDFQNQQLYSFSFTTPGSANQAHNYGKLCDRELAALTKGVMSQIVSQVTKQDERTGRTVDDPCALCMVVYDNAKCLTSQKECGPAGESIPFKNAKEEVSAILKQHQCRLNPLYKSAHVNLPGALPEDVSKWINGDTKTLSTKGWSGRNGWLGWSALLFGRIDILCDKVT